LRAFRVRSIWLSTPKKQPYSPTLRKTPVFQKPARIVSTQIVLFFLASFGLAADAVRQSQEDDLRETVFRWQLNEFGSTSLPGAAPADMPKAYFFGVGEKKEDPSDAFIKRFVDNKLPVRKLSACKMSTRGDFDKITGEKGYVLTVGSITWKSDTEVDVKGYWHVSGLCASWDTYTLKKQNGKWKVTKDKIIAQS
jgi:hypothetical protein